MGYCLCKQQSSTPLPTVGEAGLRSRPGEGERKCHSRESGSPERSSSPCCLGAPVLHRNTVAGTEQLRFLLTQE